MKGLWQKFYSRLADPRFAQAAHGWFTVFWFVAAFPICFLLSNSVAFLVFVSVYAVVTGHWAAWQACRTEVAQEEAEKRIRKIDEQAPFTP